MAKVKSKINLARIQIQLKKALTDPRLLKQLSDFLKNRIYQFTKRGISLVTEDKLLPLSPRYIEYRRKLNRQKSKQRFTGFRQRRVERRIQTATPIKTGDFFSPARSNLTLTGQMLDALESKIDQSKGQIAVAVKSTKRRGDDKTNQEVAKDVAKNGRPFLGVDQKGLDSIRRQIVADLRRKLKR